MKWYLRLLTISISMLLILHVTIRSMWIVVKGGNVRGCCFNTGDSALWEVKRITLRSLHVDLPRRLSFCRFFTIHYRLHACRSRFAYRFLNIELFNLNGTVAAAPILIVVDIRIILGCSPLHRLLLFFEFFVHLCHFGRPYIIYIIYIIYIYFIIYMQIK